MIQKGSRLFSIDNSGAGQLECIHLCDKKKFGFPGNIIIVSIKHIRRQTAFKKLVFKSKVCFAIITATSFPINRYNGTRLLTTFNTAVLLGKYNKKGITKNKPGDYPIANRFNNFIFHEVKNKGFIKIISLARGVI